MGATTYTINATGTNVRNIFDDLVEEALHYHGHDSYNGTISTTSLSGKVNIPKEILKNEKKLNDFINDDDNDRMLFPQKWETTYADLGPSHYEAFSPLWVEDLQTPKREKGVTTLQSFSISLKGETSARKKFDTLSEAKKYAKQYSLSMKEDVTVYKHRSNGSKFILGHFQLTSDGKEYKSARKAKNKVYLPINEYMFFVYAAC